MGKLALADLAVVGCQEQELFHSAEDCYLLHPRNLYKLIVKEIESQEAASTWKRHLENMPENPSLDDIWRTGKSFFGSFAGRGKLLDMDLKTFMAGIPLKLFHEDQRYFITRGCMCAMGCILSLPLFCLCGMETVVALVWAISLTVVDVNVMQANAVLDVEIKVVTAFAWLVVLGMLGFLPSWAAQPQPQTPLQLTKEERIELEKTPSQPRSCAQPQPVLISAPQPRPVPAEMGEEEEEQPAFEGARREAAAAAAEGRQAPHRSREALHGSRTRASTPGAPTRGVVHLGHPRQNQLYADGAKGLAPAADSQQGSASGIVAPTLAPQQQSGVSISNTSCRWLAMSVAICCLALLLVNPAGSDSFASLLTNLVARAEITEVAWAPQSNTYCAKSGDTVPINDDLGFGMTKSLCHEQCLKDSHCKMYTFGRWEKWGLHYGQLRCQLYARCAQQARVGTTLWAKVET